MTLMTIQELADHFPDRILCPLARGKARAWRSEQAPPVKFTYVSDPSSFDPYIWHSVEGLIDNA